MDQSVFDISTFSVSVLWRCLTRLAGNVSEARALHAAGFLGRLVHACDSSLRRRVESDIRRAFAYHRRPLTEAAVRTIARRSFLNMSMGVVEFLRFERMDRDRINAKVTVIGRRYLDDIIQRGSGGVICTLHLGNWELQGAWYGLNGYPINAIYIDQYNRALGNEMNRLRRAVDIDLVPRSELKRAVRLLKKGELVGVLADQDGGPRGEYCTLFGRLVSAPPTPAWLAGRGESPIIPVYMLRTRGGHHNLVIHEPLPVPARTKAVRKDLTRMIYRFFERIILANPEQWLWIYDRWKDRCHTYRYEQVYTDGA